MQSKIPWFRASRGEGFRKRNTVCHEQGMVVWLQDYIQFMSDDLMGCYQGGENQPEQERQSKRPYTSRHAPGLIRPAPHPQGRTNRFCNGSCNAALAEA